MTRDTKVQMLAGVVLVAALLNSAVLATRLSTLAGKNRLTFTEQVEEGQSWEETAGIAMGAFRGIFVNWLWIRANNLKEEGKFYEANELATVITKLQPRFPRVWVFHAWNMAYNISVSTNTPSERWDWVCKGISLLRDKAIPANPNDMLLHKELAWTFLHKIGGITDDANGYYKRRLAQEWTVVLGPPPAKDETDTDRKKVIAKYAAWLRKIAEAPEGMDAVIAKEPSVAVLRDRLKSEAKMGDESTGRADQLLFRYEFSKAMRLSPRRAMFEKRNRPEDTAFDAIVADPAMAKAWDALLASLRKRVLINIYHMEPDRMVRYTEEYGPIDWRCAAAHALYWSARGVELALVRYRGEIDRPEFDFLNTDRVTVQAIQDLFRSGDIYFDFLASPEDPNVRFLATPNVNFVQAYADVLDSMFSSVRAGIANNRFQRQFTMLWHGYENFIREAITYYYRRGQVKEAEEWQGKLRNDARKNTSNPELEAELNLPINEFVEKELQGEATRPDIAKAQINGSLLAAYANGLLVGDSKLFTNQFNFAASMHKYFMQEQLRNTPAGGSVPRMAQFDPDFEIMAGEVFGQFISGLSLDNAQTAYLNAPESLQCWGYAALRQSRYVPMAESEAKQGGKSFEQMFPKPGNVEQYFQEIQRRLDLRQDHSQNAEIK